MLFRTHLTFALLIALFTFNKFNINKILFFIIILFSAAFPDIDQYKSKIGRKFGIISRLINFIFGHRGIIHSLVFLIPLTIVIWIIFKNLYIPFLLGFLSHLILDGLTLQGINFLYPVSKLETKGFIRTGGLLEQIFFILLVIIVVSRIIQLI